MYCPCAAHALPMHCPCTAHAVPGTTSTCCRGTSPPGRPSPSSSRPAASSRRWRVLQHGWDAPRPWQCPSLAPAPPQGASSGSGRLEHSPGVGAGPLGARQLSQVHELATPESPDSTAFDHPGVDISPIVWVAFLSFISEILVGPQGLLSILEKSA